MSSRPRSPASQRNSSPARRRLSRSGQGPGRRHSRSAPAQPSASALPASPAPPALRESKPVGLVYIAVTDAQGTDAIDRTFRGDRQRIREWAAQQALDLIRRRLM